MDTLNVDISPADPIPVIHQGLKRKGRGLDHGGRPKGSENNLDFRSKTGAGLKYHYPHCLYTSVRKDTLDLHLRSCPRNSNREFRPPRSCKATLETLEDESDSGNDADEETSERLKCTFCEHITVDEAAKLQHQRICRKNPGAFKCGHCQYAGARRSNRDRHEKSCFSNSAPTTFKCGFCQFSSPAKKVREDHENACQYNPFYTAIKPVPLWRVGYTVTLPKDYDDDGPFRSLKIQESDEDLNLGVSGLSGMENDELPIDQYVKIEDQLASLTSNTLPHHLSEDVVRSWILKQLQSTLEDRNLSSKGRKSILVNRLLGRETHIFERCIEAGLVMAKDLGEAGTFYPRRVR